MQVDGVGQRLEEEHDELPQGLLMMRDARERERSSFGTILSPFDSFTAVSTTLAAIRPQDPFL